jgi:hypothetical protein
VAREWLSRSVLQDHYQKHRREFGVGSVSQYDGLARGFLYGPLGPNTYEVMRLHDRFTLRYNVATNELGFLNASGQIESYYKPDVAKHGLTSNLEYFFSLCIEP